MEKKEIAIKLKEFYDFNDYETTKEKLLSLAGLLHKDSSNEGMDLFLEKLNKGALGMVFKQPISLLSTFNRFKTEGTPPPYYNFVN